MPVDDDRVPPRSRRPARRRRGASGRFRARIHRRRRGRDRALGRAAPEPDRTVVHRPRVVRRTARRRPSASSAVDLEPRRLDRGGTVCLAPWHAAQAPCCPRASRTGRRRAPAARATFPGCHVPRRYVLAAAPRRPARACPAATHRAKSTWSGPPPRRSAAARCFALRCSNSAKTSRRSTSSMLRPCTTSPTSTSSTRAARAHSASRIQRSQSPSWLSSSSNPPRPRTSSVRARTLEQPPQTTFQRSTARASVQGIRRFVTVEKTELVVDPDRPGVDELGSGLARRVELDPELVGRPEIVVVQERHPRAASSGDAGVSRSRDAERPIVAHDT